MKLVLILILAYLVGSLTFANILSLVFFRTDLRKRGTGYTGASNLIAAQGFKWGILAGLLDIIKTLLVLGLARLMGLNDASVMLTGIVTALGHIYPIYFGFRGGKGGACAATTLIFMFPRESIIVLLVAIVVFALTRIPVTVFLIALVSYPIVLLFFHRPISLVLLTLALFIVLLSKIAENVISFFQGKELKVGEGEIGSSRKS